MKGNLKENLDIKNWRPISMHRILKNPKKAMMNDPLKFLQSLAKKKKGKHKQAHHSAEAFGPVNSCSSKRKQTESHDLNTRQVPDGKVQLVAHSLTG